MVRNRVVGVVLGGLKVGFTGDFNDPNNFSPVSGTYIYNINTQSSGTKNGPEGDGTLYGIAKITTRIGGYNNGLNVVLQEVYTHYRIGYIRIGSKNTDSDYVWGDWKKIY